MWEKRKRRIIFKNGLFAYFFGTTGVVKPCVSQSRFLLHKRWFTLKLINGWFCSRHKEVKNVKLIDSVYIELILFGASINRTPIVACYLISYLISK